MIWVLFFIGIVDLQTPPKMGPVAVYQTMEDCFVARDKIVEKLGKPIVGYQAVCVAYDATGEAI